MRRGLGGVGEPPPLSIDYELRASVSVPDVRASWHRAFKRSCSWHWSGRELSHPLRCPPLPLPGTGRGGGERALALL